MSGVWGTKDEVVTQQARSPATYGAEYGQMMPSPKICRCILPIGFAIQMRNTHPNLLQPESNDIKQTESALLFRLILSSGHLLLIIEH